MSRMSGQATAAVGDSVVYSYRPSLLGAAWQFKLADDGIDWVAGRRSGRIPFRDVRRVRMSFRPANLQSQRFLTEIWAAGAPKLEIVSSSWKSMFDQERLDKSYAAFIAAFLALFVWHGGNYLRRNRPGVYHPDALPADLLPKG